MTNPLDSVLKVDEAPQEPEIIYMDGIKIIILDCAPEEEPVEIPGYSYVNAPGAALDWLYGQGIGYASLEVQRGELLVTMPNGVQRKVPRGKVLYVRNGLLCWDSFEKVNMREVGDGQPTSED